MLQQRLGVMLIAAVFLGSALAIPWMDTNPSWSTYYEALFEVVYSTERRAYIYIVAEIQSPS